MLNLANLRLCCMTSVFYQSSVKPNVPKHFRKNRTDSAPNIWSVNCGKETDLKHALLRFRVKRAAILYRATNNKMDSKWRSPPVSV